MKEHILIPAINKFLELKHQRKSCFQAESQRSALLSLSLLYLPRLKMVIIRVLQSGQFKR
jgi:hypothetical protein